MIRFENVIQLSLNQFLFILITSFIIIIILIIKIKLIENEWKNDNYVPDYNLKIQFN